MRKLLAILSGPVFVALGSAQTLRFDSDAVGSVPPGWTVAMTHAGGAPKWQVLNDDSAPSKPNVLAQVSTDPTSGRFPLAIYEKAGLKDGALTVKFKPVSGARDQAAGLVWRYRDPDNYYIVRANALENNVVLYKVESGKRISLAPKGAPTKTYGVKHPVPSGVWSTLSVSFQGHLFTVSLNGHKLFEVEDSTFTEAGKVGLWTKADSVTHFDDFQVVRK
ncbi:MAG: family 16 glycoside hydrolase [Acidobacteriota bacterium]